MILFFKFVPIGILISCLILPLSIDAYSPITIQFNTQPLTGFSTYTIGGLTESKLGQFAYHFPVSKLRFPTNTDVASISVSSYLSPRVLTHLQIKKNTSYYAGKLQDSDWLSPDETIQDIYSESDTQLHFYSVDLTVRIPLQSIIYKNNNKTLYRLFLGYKYQNFSFTAYDLVQWYPSTPLKKKITQPGTVITYQLKQYIPYWTFDMTQTLGSLTIEFSGSYSPFVTINDIDNHILRSKLANGSLKGYMLANRFLLKYPLTSYISGFLCFYSQTIQSYGTQIQSRYKKTSEGNIGHIADIDQKIESILSELSFGITYLFRSNPSNFSSKLLQNDLSLVSIGTSFYIPLQERSIGVGPHLEIMKHSFILGIGCYQGNNHVKTLSKGIYRIIPVYIMYKIPFMSFLKFGGGYSFYDNTIDPQAISYLESKGISNTQETVKSTWFTFLSLDMPIPYDNNLVTYFVRYIYQNTIMKSFSDQHHQTKPIDLSSLQLGIKIAL